MSNNRALDREDVVDLIVEREGVAREDVKFTCDTCGSLFSCQLAYDPYNRDGDCLADK